MKYFGTFASNGDAESTKAAKPKKKWGGGLTEFSSISKFDLGWFKLEVKVRARCSFSVNQSIRIYPNDHTTELQEAEDQEVAVEGQGLVPEPAPGAEPAWSPQPGQPGAGS